jgi:hypothetical protein
MVALAVVLVIALAAPSQTSARGCVDVSILGPTGGAAIHQCGANARDLCRSAGRGEGYVGETAREIKAACIKDGIPVS